MTSQNQTPVPTEIDLHKKSRILEITFDDGSRFELPCEYLRVFSPSAETRVSEYRGEPVLAKETVNITSIEPIGTYAVRLAFDDGHDTGIYSWDTLYRLGRDFSKNWKTYLARKQLSGRSGYQGRTAGPGGAKVRVLYFERLVDRLGRQAEDVDLAGPVTDVRALLGILGARSSSLGEVFSLDAVKVTVNKQFAGPDTILQDNDEVAIVPVRPVG